MNKSLTPADMLALLGNIEESPVKARHVAGQIAMQDPRAAQLLALFHQSDERGRVTLLAFAAIHAARYPKEPK